LLPVLAGLAVGLLRRVLTWLLTVRTLLARIWWLLLLASRRRLPVLLWLAIRPGLLLPVRIRRILPVLRLLPVTAHVDKISAQDIWAQTTGAFTRPRSNAAARRGGRNRAGSSAVR
jgi:hypothetical protein